jgi:cytochrome oxidase Cu insertion factor (SCO1/SenC/PrrC family)
MRRFTLAITIALLASGVLLTGSSLQAGPADVEVLLADLDVTVLPAAVPPQFKLDTFDGKPLALADLRGHPALIYFWATW